MRGRRGSGRQGPSRVPLKPSQGRTPPFMGSDLPWGRRKSRSSPGTSSCYLSSGTRTGTTHPVASMTGLCFLGVEAGSPRFWFGSFRDLSPACGQPPPLCVPTPSSLLVGVLISSHRDTSHIGLGLILRTSSSLTFLQILLSNKITFRGTGI